jgi:hypothetical protein
MQTILKTAEQLQVKFYGSFSLPPTCPTAEIDGVAARGEDH